jgi:hypothetical protein
MRKQFEFEFEGRLAYLEYQYRKAESVHLARRSVLKSREAERDAAQERLRGWQQRRGTIERQAAARSGDSSMEIAHGSRMIYQASEDFERRQQEVARAKALAEEARVAADRERLKWRQLEVYRDYRKAEFKFAQEQQEMAEAAEVGNAMHYLNQIAMRRQWARRSETIS